MALEHSDISKMLEVAVVAARLAGQRAMEEIKYVKTSIKNDSEMLTNADGLCQHLIIDRIKQTYPDHGFLAEEGSDGAAFKQSPRGSKPIWWVIDPIDGTNNYAHGILCFGVSIAAFYDGSPILGVIFDPATESMYTAAKDTDALLNASRITVSEEQISEYGSFGIDSHFKADMTEGINQIMRQTRFRNLGTTVLQLAYVAKGSFLGSVTTVAKIWDIAAGIIIIENAGGIVTDYKGNKIFPVDLENCTDQNYSLLAANKKTHPKFLEIFKA